MKTKNKKDWKKFIPVPILKKKEQPQDEKLKEIDVLGRKRVHQKDLEPDKFYYEAMQFTPQYNLTKKQIRKEAELLKKHVGKIVLIKMELANGFFREFLVYEDSGYFYFNKSLYVFDHALKYYLIERNIWAYDFHELMSLPLKKEFHISDAVESIIMPVWDEKTKKPIPPHVNTNELRSLIENAEVVDVEASINPTTLKRFTDSEVIKQVLQGATLGKVFKIMFILIIIIAFFALISLIIQMYNAGLFEKLRHVFGK